MSPPTVSTADAPDSDPPPRGGDAVAGTGSWEEPHPGRRFRYPSDAPASGAAPGAHPGGNGGGDTAAKGPRPQHDYRVNPRQWLVRRHARVRVRNSLLRPLTIPKGAGSVEPAAKSAPVSNMYPTNPCDGPAVPAMASGAGVVDLGPADAEFEADCGSSATEVATRASISDMAEDASTIRGPPSPVLVSPELHFTDFSNHLGIHLEPDFDDDGSVVTVVDSEVPSHLTPGDDLYGWEAELDRKTSEKAPPAHGESCCCADIRHYRRAGGCRRSLLHRVFHLKHPPKQPTVAVQPMDTSADDGGMIPEEGMTF